MGGGQRHSAGRTWRVAALSVAVLLGLVARSAVANDINHKVGGRTVGKGGESEAM